MAEVERSWTDQQLQSDEVSKKDIIKFLHEHASFEVLETYFLLSAFFHPVSNQVCRRGSVFFFLRSETITHWSTSQREGVFDLCLVGVLIDVHCTFGMTLEMLALFYRKVSFYEILTESRKVIPFGLKPYLTPFIHVHKTACEIACRNEY